MAVIYLQNEIEETVYKLLEMAKGLTWNKISGNCKFILTEIKNNTGNFHEQNILRRKENERKKPVSLTEIIPALQTIYCSLYDINLHIYRSTNNLTIIDIRYYPKYSLDNDYQQKVLNNLPMLHCKVSMPAGLSDNKEKFDINWEYYEGMNKMKIFWLKLRQKIKSG